MKAAVKSAIDDIDVKIKKESQSKPDQENYDEYIKYSKILNELKERGYFNIEEYSDKIEKLKRHFNIH